MLSFSYDSPFSQRSPHTKDFPTEARSKNSKMLLLYLLSGFIVMFSFMTTTFWYIGAVSLENPLNIYLSTPKDHLKATIISANEAKQIIDNVKDEKSTFSTRNTHPITLNPQCILPDMQKLNCHPDKPVTEDECFNRGCCYHLIHNPNNEHIEADHPNPSVPTCYYPWSYIGYEITTVNTIQNGLNAVLVRRIPSGFPNDIQKVNLCVTYIDERTLRIKFTDADAVRFETPIVGSLTPKKVQEDQQLYYVELSPDGILAVKRKISNEKLFSTNLHLLVYSDQFLQISTTPSTKHIFGLGEHYDHVKKNFNWTLTTLFNRDNWPAPFINLYGMHPLYLGLEHDKNTHAIFLLTSNSLDITLQPNPTITYRTIGGILDFFIFLGPSPSHVVEQYTSIIGRSFMPPYWSLGFHLCRYGYGSLDKTKRVWKRTIQAGIPFDTQWNDIDYMERYNDFTYDKDKYRGLPEFVHEVHNKGMHYVPIVDPGISNSEPPGAYPPYDDGIREDLFIKDVEGDIFIGKVWNFGDTVFPDFSHPAAMAYWARQLKSFYSVIPFDGLWIDMNEPANFYNGTVNGCPGSSPLDRPPYIPGGMEPLETHTLCMSAQHFYTSHYNEHSLYAYREAVATYYAIRNITKKREFIISRANFAGQGRFSGHWGGDMGSTWEDMRYSIYNMLTFNIFGLPMVGSDICGFRGNTTIELCARWQALGAFYPFSRNHNDYDTMDQDPVAMGNVVVTATKNTLFTRYRLLPYLYTLFYKSHVYGETVIRPLFFEFVKDENTYDIDEQFLWGPCLMIMPALYPGINQITAYFPKAIWYNYYTGEKMNVSAQQIALPAPYDSINIALRGGYIIPHQHDAQTTTKSRLNMFTLLAGLDENDTAVGELYWDDGETIDSYELGNYNLIQFSINEGKFMSDVKNYGYDSEMNLDYVKICGMSSVPSNVTVNDTVALFEFDMYNCLKITAKISLQWSFHMIWF